MAGESEERTIDYYEILEVRPDATEDELLAAYRYRAYMLHPDRSLDASQPVRTNAEREFDLVNEAWAVLKDPERRRAYDESRQRQLQMLDDRKPLSPGEGSAKGDDIPRRRREDAKALNDEGIALAELGRWDAARRYFDRAIDKDESFTDAWINKGVSLDNLQRWDNAIRCYDRALEIDSSLVGAWYNKGVALRSLGKDDEAAYCFARARDPLGVTEIWADRRSAASSEDRVNGTGARLGAARSAGRESSGPAGVRPPRTELVVPLTVFGVLWLAGIAIALGYVGTLLATHNLWVGQIAATNDPIVYSLLRWVGIALAPSPGIGSLWLAGRLKSRPTIVRPELC